MRDSASISSRSSCFPLLTGYFAWKRRLDAATLVWITGAYVFAAILVLLYPFVPRGQTEALAVVHLPIALLPMVGIAYGGGRWNEVTGRMDLRAANHD